MWCVQRRACPRLVHLNLFPPPTPLINYHQPMVGNNSLEGVESDRCVGNPRNSCFANNVLVVPFSEISTYTMAIDLSIGYVWNTSKGDNSRLT